MGMAAFEVCVYNLTKTFPVTPASEDLSFTKAVAEAVKRTLRPPERKTVVDGISLSVERGEFFGIIGSNGAGKTTFLKMLACLLYPDAGGGFVHGYDLLRQRTDVRRSVVVARAGGWLGTLSQLTGRENLLFRAKMCGLSRRQARERADYVLARLGIEHKANEYSWNWSAGEQQKFSLAMTFVARTPIVILDEPTSHLDPHAARTIREFIKEELNERNGQTVIMSTHYLEEADILCDRVAILHEGRLLACDAPFALRRKYASEPILEMRVSGYTPEIGRRVQERCGLAELLEQFEDVTTGQARLRPRWPDSVNDPNTVQRVLEAEGVPVTSVRWVEPSMEDVYFNLTREKLR